MHTMTRRLLTFAVAMATASTFMLATGAGAEAATPSNTVCNGGLAPGTYKNVTVTRYCGLDSSVTITGNLSIGTGAIAMIGSEGSEGPSIAGNVSAVDAHAVYIFGAQIGKNLTLTGGGPGANCVDPDPNTSFGNDTMVKDSQISGNVTISGWAGCWFGFLRNTVGGNATISNMYANPLNINFPGTPDETLQGLDSTEIANNQVGRILSCTGNTPAAQFGDSGGGPNTVGMKALGECAALV